MKEYSFDVYEVKKQVLEFMAKLGISPYNPDKLNLDGTLQRYRIYDEKPGKKSGAYTIFLNGWPAGYVQDWRTGIKENWKFKLDNDKYSQEQQKYFRSDEFKKKCEQERIKREKRQQELRQQAISLVNTHFGSYEELTTQHPYLQVKDVGQYNLRARTINDRGKKIFELAVPLMNIDGKLISIQYIYKNEYDKFEKRFFPDAPTSEIFWEHNLQEIRTGKQDTLIIAEGFATAAKCHELTGLPVVAAMYCENLKKVAKILRDKFPKITIIIAADNDKNTEIKTGKNPGIEAAKFCVENNFANTFIAPPFLNPDDGTDWDDFALKFGKERAAKALNTEIEEYPLKEKQKKYLQKAQELGLMSGSSFEDFCKPAQGDRWLIQDWVQANSLMMLFAPSASGKSFVALDMAFAVACPYINYWHDKKVVSHGGVVYVASEGQNGLRKRSAGLASYKGVMGKDVNIHYITEGIPLNAKDPEEGVDKLIANIGARCPNPKLVFIDTVNGCFTGDENLTKDATPFINACKKIIKEFNCTVIFIHHTGHSLEARGRARGSSAFNANVDIELKISKEGKNTIHLEMSKNKDNEEQPPMVFHMKVINAPGFIDEDGRQETTCILEYDAETSKLAAANTGGSKPPSQAETFAKDTYREAAYKEGFIGLASKEHEEYEDYVTVNVEDWRKVFYNRTAAEGPTAKRMAFNRARKMLLETKNILFKETDSAGRDWVCLKPTGSEFENDIRAEINKREG